MINGSAGDYALFKNGPASLLNKSLIVFDQELSLIGEVPDMDIAKEQSRSFTDVDETCWIYSGFAMSGTYPRTNIDLYDKNLVHSSLPCTRYENTAGIINDHVVFAGASNLPDGNYSGAIYSYPVFEISTRTQLDEISTGYSRQNISGVCSVGDSIIVVGGSLSEYNEERIDKNLTKTVMDTTTKLTSLVSLVGHSCGKYGIIGGGYDRNSYLSSTIVFDPEFTRSSGPMLLTPHNEDDMLYINGEVIVWPSRDGKTITIIDPNLTARSGGETSYKFNSEICGKAILAPDRIISINTYSLKLEIFRFE